MQVGEGADGWLGKRVVAITQNALGGISEYAMAQIVSVFDAPAELDDAEATAFLLTFQTSHLALFKRGRLKAGETLVVHSAASGLGTAGIQLGMAKGARVIAVAGGPEKGALCRSLGADLIMDHITEDFVEAVLAATGDAARSGLRPDRGGVRRASWRCTAQGGRYLAVGFANNDANGMTGRPLRMACIGNIDIVRRRRPGWTGSTRACAGSASIPSVGTSPTRSTQTCCGWPPTGKIRPVVGKRVARRRLGRRTDEHEARGDHWGARSSKRR